MPADEPPQVRDEDAFDVAAVDGWLRGRTSLPDGLPEVRQFAGGASNLTYLLRWPAGPELVLRRPPAGQKAASAHDMGREFRVQSALAAPFPYVPELVGLCEDPAVLGSTFYVMHRVPGTILRARLPEGFSLPEVTAREITERIFDSLAALHSVDVDAAGLGDLGRGPGYVGRQVAGWSDRFRKARTDNVPDLEGVMAWLDAHQPLDVGMCLVHNDFRLDNVIFDDDWQVRAILDWEMATVGDPLMDLGGALAYWVQADDDDVRRMSRRQPSDLPGMPTREEIVARYAQASGLSVDDWPFYEVFGLFRLAVIVQQIYFRFHHGQTTNPAFKDYWAFVTYLDHLCRTRVGLA